MRKIRLPKVSKKHPIAFWVAVALHGLLLIGIIFISFEKYDNKKSTNVSSKPVVAKAITIDLNAVNKEKQRLITLKKQKQLKIEKEKKLLKDLHSKQKKLLNEEKKQQKKIKQIQEKVKKEKKLAAKKIAEELNKRKIIEKKTKEAQKIKKAADANAKKSEEKAKKAEEKAKKAEETKKVAEAKAKTAEQKKKLIEKKTKEAQKIKKEIEAKTKESQRIKNLVEKKRLEEQQKFAKEQKLRLLKHEIQDEENQERQIAQDSLLNELKASYINRIAARVRGQWRYKGAQDDWQCSVYILQDTLGNVQSVNVESCSVDNSIKAKAFKDSIERAIYKSSPLPSAPDKNVFDAEIRFTFGVGQ